MEGVVSGRLSVVRELAGLVVSVDMGFPSRVGGFGDCGTWLRIVYGIS